MNGCGRRQSRGGRAINDGDKHDGLFRSRRIRLGKYGLGAVIASYRATIAQTEALDPYQPLARHGNSARPSESGPSIGSAIANRV